MKAFILIVTAMRTSTFATCCHPNVYRQWQEIYLFYKTSRQAVGPSQPPIQFLLGSLSLGEKLPGHEGDHSPPSSVEVKNEWSYVATSHVCLNAWHGANFTFYRFTEYMCCIVRTDSNWFILHKNVHIDNM